MPVVATTAGDNDIRELAPVDNTIGPEGDEPSEDSEGADVVVTQAFVEEETANEMPWGWMFLAFVAGMIVKR